MNFWPKSISSKSDGKRRMENQKTQISSPLHCSLSSLLFTALSSSCSKSNAAADCASRALACSNRRAAKENLFFCVADLKNCSAAAAASTGDPPPRPDKLLGGLLRPDFEEASCVSRYQSSQFWHSNHTPSSYLLRKLRSYEALHKKCGPNTEPSTGASNTSTPAPAAETPSAIMWCGSKPAASEIDSSPSSLPSSTPSSTTRFSSSASPATFTTPSASHSRTPHGFCRPISPSPCGLLLLAAMGFLTNRSTSVDRASSVYSPCSELRRGISFLLPRDLFSLGILFLSSSALSSKHSIKDIHQDRYKPEECISI